MPDLTDDKKQQLAQCVADCRSKYSWQGQEDKLNQCLQACQDKFGEGDDSVSPPTGSPCKGDGKLGKNVRAKDGSWILATPCEAGYNPVKATDGKIWCCKVKGDEPEEPKPEDPCPGKGHWKESEDEECGEGFKSIYSGTAKKTKCCPEDDDEDGDETEDCPKGNYFASKDGTCPDGYVFVKRSGSKWEGYEDGSPGRCECSAWCLKSGYEADCKTPKGGGGGGGEWKWPEDITGGYDALMERLLELLNMPRGLSEAERQAITNFATTQIQGSERGRLEDARGRLARMGTLNETYYSPEEEGIKRETRQLTSGVQQGIAIDEMTRRFSEIMQTTGMSAELLQFLSTFPTTQEALNAGRRGESSQALQMLMAMLSGQGNNFNYSPWMQGLTTQYGGQYGQGGGGSMDWLAYLPFLLGGYGTGTRTYG